MHIADKFTRYKAGAILTNKDVALQISTLHAAWKAFIASESCNKLKLAICRNVQKSRTAFNRGDKVFYKHHNKLAWKGPGQALGQDGPVIHIRHSRHYIKSHSCLVQLTKRNSNNDNTKTNNTVPTTTTTKTASPSLNQQISYPVSDDKIGTDNNRDDENKNIPNIQEILNTITNNEDIDF